MNWKKTGNKLVIMRSHISLINENQMKSSDFLLTTTNFYNIIILWYKGCT